MNLRPLISLNTTPTYCTFDHFVLFGPINNEVIMNDENNPPVAADVLAIESLEDYLQRYGLPPNINNDDDGINGEFNGLNRSEAEERIEAEKAYLHSVIEKHRSDNNEDESALHTGFTPRDHDCDEDGMISIILANKERHAVPIKPLYQFCETVRRMVVHRSRFGVANKNDDVTDQEHDCNNDYDAHLEIGLEDFDMDAVLQFTTALQSLYDYRQQLSAVNNSSSDEQKPCNQQIDRRDNQTSIDESCAQHILQMIDNRTISPNSIIEVLKLSHFLQCNLMLDTLVSIVESSIDLENCLSICSLADALNLTTLFESSVNFVIQRLDAFQGSDGSNDDSKTDALEGETDPTTLVHEDTAEELWKSLPYDLRSRLLTMRNLLRSSIIGRGSKISGVFFSSGNEFLAIFRETISVQKERMAEARERLEEVVRERKDEFDMKRQRRGRWFDSSEAAEQKFVYGGDVAYSMRQIEKQAKRLATLESFYSEQKLIFSKFGDGECKLSFD